MTTAVVHRYAPRGAARRLLSERRKEVLLSGPAGTGKSTGCLEKLHAVAAKYPGMHGLIVRKTAASLPTSALKTWRERVAAESIATNRVSWYGGSREEPPQYRFTNGSSIVVGGMDKATKVMSTDYDMIFAQEATELTLDDWEALTTRLRHGKMPYQQLIADCNPNAGTHWLKQRADRGTTLMMASVHADNPMLYDDNGVITERGREYMSILDALTGVRRLRLRDGLWVAAEGVIYDEWNPALNERDPYHERGLGPPAEWRRFWTVDFGTTNPFVCQFWAEDPDGRLIMYREVYMTGRMVTDHAERILHLVTKADGVTWKEPKPEAIICDHDADGRMQFEKVIGIGTVAANKTVAVKDGIELVQLRIRPAIDGKPRLIMCRGALAELDQDLHRRGLPTSTLEELGSYVWNPAKDQPIKEHDHGMDAMRYLVVYLDHGSEIGVRWL